MYTRLVGLSGAQARNVKEALLDGFRRRNALAQLLRHQLDVSLDSITTEDGLDAAMFAVVEWADARGRVIDLITAARNLRPHNQRLYAVAAELGLAAESGATLEAVVGDNDLFLDAEVWRVGLTAIEGRVCRVDRDGRGVGTGFLVGPDLVLTNYHVVEQLIQAPHEVGRWSCRFDYKRALAETREGRVVALAGEWLVDASRYSPVDTVPDPKPREPADDELDHALVRLQDPVGRQTVGAHQEGAVRGWVDLRAGSASIDLDTRVMISIVQHPRTQPMKLAMGMVERLVWNSSRTRVRYTVPTEPGSSGSPVFDQAWRLLAIHHGGEPDRIKTYNQGIPATRIAARPGVAGALPAEAPPPFEWSAAEDDRRSPPVDDGAAERSDRRPPHPVRPGWRGRLALAGAAAVGGLAVLIGSGGDDPARVGVPAPGSYVCWAGPTVFEDCRVTRRADGAVELSFQGPTHDDDGLVDTYRGSLVVLGDGIRFDLVNTFNQAPLHGPAQTIVSRLDQATGDQEWRFEWTLSDQTTHDFWLCPSRSLPRCCAVARTRHPPRTLCGSTPSESSNGRWSTTLTRRRS